MDRLHQVHEIVTELWKWYRQAYESMVDTDEWWEKAIEGARKLADEKFDGDKVALNVAGALMNDLEKICKERKRI